MMKNAQELRNEIQLNIETALTNSQVSIVNPHSNFVVATYWWGNENKNMNTSRFCKSIYEEFILESTKQISLITNGIFQNEFGKNNKNFVAECIHFIKLENSLDDPIYQKFINLQNNVTFKNNMEKRKNITLEKFSTIFYNHLKETFEDDLNSKIINSNNTQSYALSDFTKNLYEDVELKKMSNIIDDKGNIEIKQKQFIFNQIKLTKTKNIYIILKDIFEKNFEINFENCLKLSCLQYLKNIFVYLYKNKSSNDNWMRKFFNNLFNVQVKDHKKYFGFLIQKKKEIKQNITSNQKNKIFKIAENKDELMNIYDIMIHYFTWKTPISYKKMIEKWENKCRSSNCNYLSVYVPEFEQTGGYQKAINAKPMFIKKALEKCEGRAILYIDGDMYVNKYPYLFDSKTTDFMARGWWIDPRTSYRIEESVMIDPYMFETSGGIMFFANTRKSLKLIDDWVNETYKERNLGKADDRILSLIFNAKKYLLELSVIQIPSEYLWLSMDYNNRMLEYIFEWDFFKMKNSIIVEHPECLTTEDTASGMGASSDRQPDFYAFIEDLNPISELLCKDIIFENKEIISEVGTYIDYLKNECYYINDLDEPDNNIWMDNNLIHKEGYDSIKNKRFNKQPFIVYSYENPKYTTTDVPNIKDVENEIFFTALEIHEIGNEQKTTVELYIKKIIEKNKDILDSMNYLDNSTETKPQVIYLELKSFNRKLFPEIVYYLQNNVSVIFNVNSESEEERQKVQTYLNIESEDLILSVIEFNVNTRVSDYYKFLIDFQKPIIFNALSRNKETVIKMLMMHENFEHLSLHFSYGAYQYISKIRINIGSQKILNLHKRKQKSIKNDDVVLAPGSILEKETFEETKDDKTPVIDYVKSLLSIFKNNEDKQPIRGGNLSSTLSDEIQEYSQNIFTENTKETYEGGSKKSSKNKCKSKKKFGLKRFFLNFQ